MQDWRCGLQLKPNVQAGPALMHLQHSLVVTKSLFAARLFFLQ
jgi:hypothetical protein